MNPHRNLRFPPQPGFVSSHNTAEDLRDWRWSDSHINADLEYQAELKRIAERSREAKLKRVFWALGMFLMGLGLTALILWEASN